MFCTPSGGLVSEANKRKQGFVARPDAYFYGIAKGLAQRPVAVKKLNK